MEKLNMSVDYIAVFPVVIGGVMLAANLVILVMQLMHKEQFVRRALNKIANFVWVFRLGGGAAYWIDRRSQFKR
jgi:hypothetical protein